VPRQRKFNEDLAVINECLNELIEQVGAALGQLLRVQRPAEECCTQLHGLPSTTPLPFLPTFAPPPPAPALLPGQEHAAGG
jgi:hypothetical protein